jgi:heme-degrading monooxygenase HmoA
MILEVAILNVKAGREADFEAAFKKAEPLAITGYSGHEMRRCIEHPSRYLLVVKWEKIEDHTVGFRHSAEYQQWRRTSASFLRSFSFSGTLRNTGMRVACAFRSGRRVSDQLTLCDRR